MGVRGGQAAGLLDIEKLKDAGLLTKDTALADEIPIGIDGEDDEASRDAVEEPTVADGLEP